LVKSVSDSNGKSSEDGVMHGVEVDAAVKVKIPFFSFFGLKAGVAVSVETSANWSADESDAVLD
jgi:hypothetical protein